MNVIDIASLRLPSGGAARFEGANYGANVSCFVVASAPGRGADKHRHPYAETFVILHGDIEVIVDGAARMVSSGMIVVIPANAWHEFKKGTTRRISMQNIHLQGSTIGVLGGRSHIDAIAEPSDSSNAPLTEFEGYNYGSDVSLIFVYSNQSSFGPHLHQHPYSETFVIRSGRALFTVGEEQVVGIASQVLVVPASTPHKFEVIGPEYLDMLDIHASPRFATEWLEAPRAKQ